MKLNAILNLSMVLVFATACEQSRELSFIDRIQPVPKKSGFRMEGYWVWGGSIIKVSDTYNLFASRWPKGRKFPLNYRNMSEIVRATSSNILGPYEFQEVVIGERDSLFWDSNMAHNPTVHKIDDRYVLFYIGSDFTTQLEGSKNLLRRIGYATATSITGPWERSNQPVIDVESNNPAVLINDAGSVYMMYRDAPLRVFVATAPEFAGPYTLKNDDVWPDCKLEDFFLFTHQGQHRMICEDAVGQVSGHDRWGIQFSSNDGIHWDTCDDLVVYDHDIQYDNGTILHCTRRERPQLYIEEGKVVVLVNGVYDGNDSWCQPVRVEPGY